MSQKILQGKDFPSNQLKAFIYGPQLAFEHLDWLPSQSRLSEESTFCLIDDDEIQAILSVAPENPHFAWLRFFFTQWDGNHNANFTQLFEHAKNWLKDNQISKLYSLATSEWIERLLIKHGFQLDNQIVSLGSQKLTVRAQALPENLQIRPMHLDDIPELENLDELCFRPPWQMNQISLEKSYSKGADSSVVSQAGRLVGYQITNNVFDHLHLARIAVHPDLQGRGIARQLMAEMINFFNEYHIQTYTVNTQADNLASLRLYHSFGFKEEGRPTPVYLIEMY
ncbi:MAG: GNAT family N-acetyltransferase [Anaerolineaceae bacterium]|nr:GNAT family N-acetyltransferase [Anaerolineaceae bacterium]